MSNNFDVGYKNGFARGAASRDAEVAKLLQGVKSLQDRLANSVIGLYELTQERAQLRNQLELIHGAVGAWLDTHSYEAHGDLYRAYISLAPAEDLRRQE
jgi:hypothetical protein